MAMTQIDNNIEQIRRLEGLIAYAEEQKDWDEVERLKKQLRRLAGAGVEPKDMKGGRWTL